MVGTALAMSSVCYADFSDERLSIENIIDLNWQKEEWEQESFQSKNPYNLSASVTHTIVIGQAKPVAEEIVPEVLPVEKMTHVESLSTDAEEIFLPASNDEIVHEDIVASTSIDASSLDADDESKVYTDKKKRRRF